MNYSNAINPLSKQYIQYFRVFGKLLQKKERKKLGTVL